MEHPAELQKILNPQEQILWTGRPDPWFYARPTFMIYIVAVPWTIFTFFWLDAVTGGFQWPKETAPPIPWWMPWIGIWAGLILLAAGLWMLTGPFWIWRRGKRTLYALTSQRAVILDLRRLGKMRALDLKGKINFRVSHPEKVISDLEVVAESKKGIVLQAVQNPARIVTELKSCWSISPQPGTS